MQSNLVEVGCLWKGKDKTGKTILTGKMGARARLLILPNGHKEKENQPDFLAYVAPDRKQGEGENGVRRWSEDDSL